MKMINLLSLSILSTLLFGFFGCNIATNSEQVLSLASKSDSSSSSNTNDKSAINWDQPITPTKITCDASTPKIVSTIQRLTKRQITNSMSSFLSEIDASLFSDAQLTTLINSLPSDTIAYKENSLLITQQIVNIQFDIFYRVATLIAASPTALNALVGNNGCLASTTISTTCQNTFVKNLGRILYRRNLETTEVNNLLAFFSNNELLNNTDKITAVIASVLGSADHNYQIYDKGTPSSNSNSSIVLSSIELSNKLAFFLTSAPPDTSLRTVANNGTLLQKDVLTAQIDRLLKSAKGQESLLKFYKEWLHYDQYDGFMYSNEFLSGQSLTNLQNAMTREVDELILNLNIHSKTATFKDLLTTTQSYIYDDSLAQLYGVSNPRGLTNLNSRERSGLLTRAAFLAKRSGILTSPIKRGITIKEYMLCEGVGAPPPNAPTKVDPLPEGVVLSTRERIAAMTEKNGTSCTTCHSIINPLGYPFEMYDSIGRYRSQEKIYNTSGTATGKFATINTQSTTGQLDNTRSIAITDAVSLSHELATSKKAQICMAIRWNEYLLRRTAKNQDACAIEQSYKHLAGTGDQAGSLYDLIISTVSSDSFKTWNY